MDEERILDELLVLLEAHGVRIRRDALAGQGGGLCQVRGERLFFLDTEASLGDSAVLCARALNEVVDIESIYIRPEVREFVEKAIGKEQ